MFNFRLKILVLLVILFAGSQLFGQWVKQPKGYDITKLKKDIPKLLSTTNAGKDFWCSFHPCFETYGTGNMLYIYISSSVKTMVTIEVPGKGYFTQKTTIPNDIISFGIDPSVGQPYRRTDTQPPLTDSIYKGAGIHIYADQPIIVYGVSRFSYTSDSYLALPVSSLGKEYIVASWPDIADDGLTFGQYLTSYTEVVAAYDSTKVRFTLGGTNETVTAGGQKPGQTTTWMLYKGDVLMFGSLGAFADLTGSKWSATKPVACFSGSYGAYVPENNGYWDFLMEEELPTNTWGTQYHYTPIAGRLRNSMIRIFAKENNTTIYRDGQKLAFIKYAGGIRGDGWLSMRADITTAPPRAIVFSADKPFNITQYNTGQTDDGIVSDPFQMVLTPFEQYQKEITFNTPGIKGGKGFNINWINIVYRTKDDGTMPDDLMFAQVQGGNFVWKSINSFSPDPGMPYSILVNGHHYSCKQLLLPGDGVYKIKANDPFCAYAYGFSPYDSYGHPTSVALGDLERPDTLAPHPTWWMDRQGSLWYDSTMNGDPIVEDWPQNADRSNLSMINMDPDLSYNYKFSYNDFVPGEDASTTWLAEVIDNSQEARLVVTFSDRRGNDTTIDIHYTPFVSSLAIQPDLDFGDLAIGDTVNKDIWLINISSQFSAKVDSLRFKLQNQGFTISGITLPITLQPMDSVKFQIRFIATKDGNFMDSLGANDSNIFSYKSQLKASVLKPPKDTLAPVPQWAFCSCCGKIHSEYSHDSDATVEDLPRNRTRSNIATVKINLSKSFNFNFISKDLVPPDPAMKIWGGRVIDMSKDARCEITFSDNAGNDTTIVIEYFAVQLSLKPDLDFGKLKIGDYIEKDIWLTNNSKTAPVFIDSLSLLFKDKGFEIENIDLPLTIPTNQFMDFKIKFNATQNGLFIDSVGVGDTCNFYFKSQVKAQVGDSINAVYDLINPNNSIAIFPNPANNSLNISYILNANKNVIIMIIDVLGNEVYSASEQGMAGTNYSKIDINALPQGVYYLKLSAGADAMTRIIEVVR